MKVQLGEVKFTVEVREKEKGITNRFFWSFRVGNSAYALSLKEFKSASIALAHAQEVINNLGGKVIEE